MCDSVPIPVLTSANARGPYHVCVSSPAATSDGRGLDEAWGEQTPKRTCGSRAEADQDLLRTGIASSLAALYNHGHD